MYILAALSEARLGLMYPELRAILYYAEKESRILQVAYQDLCGEDEVRWHRSQASEEFQKDVYTLYWDLECVSLSRQKESC